jgi:histidinol phosphatase-like PHP family hydrolase
MDEIDRRNETLQGFRILKSCEVDILPSGALDLPDSVLARLDVVIGAIHSNFGLSAKAIGLKLAISSDAHSTLGLANIRYGVDQARRGRLSAEDILNTRGWPELKTLLTR